jgi:hypothetical protein
VPVLCLYDKSSINCHLRKIADPLLVFLRTLTGAPELNAQAISKELFITIEGCPEENPDDEGSYFDR